MPSGRPRKPTAIKVAEGNRAKVGKKHLKPDVAGIGTPRIPSHFKPDERARFCAVIESLPPTLLSRADEGALEQYAQAWARMRRAKLILDAEGEIIISPQGKVKHPALMILERASLEMTRVGSLLGLSPAARAKLAAVAAGEDDPMADLLGMDNDADGTWQTQPTTKN